MNFLTESEIAEIIKCIDLKKKHVQESLANNKAIIRFNCFNREEMKILEFDLTIESDYGPMIDGLRYKGQYSFHTMMGQSYRAVLRPYSPRSLNFI
jgi:hypothetical protein